jgi:hypothetical protein
MSDDQKLTPVHQRGGRPRTVNEGASVSAWIDAKHYDQLVRLANKQDKSVSTVVRELLVLRLR